MGLLKNKNQVSEQNRSLWRFFLYKEKETFNDFLVLQLANLFFFRQYDDESRSDAYDVILNIDLHLKSETLRQ